MQTSFSDPLVHAFQFQARVLHHAVERMRFLITQVDTLSKENARLARQNEQLWEQVRGGLWKPAGADSPNMTSMGATTSVSAAATAAQMQQAVAAQQLGNAAHFMPFLLPHSFQGGVFPTSPLTSATTAPPSPQPGPPAVLSNLPRLDAPPPPTASSRPMDPDSRAPMNTSPLNSIPSNMQFDSAITRNLLLAGPFSSLLPNMANAALSALSQAELQPQQQPSNLGIPQPQLPTMSTMGLLPSISSMHQMGPDPSLMSLQRISPEPSAGRPK